MLFLFLLLVLFFLQLPLCLFLGLNNLHEKVITSEQLSFSIKSLLSLSEHEVVY